MSPADDGCREGHEGFMDVVTDLPANAQAAEPAQQGDRSLHDPAVKGNAADLVQLGEIRDDEAFRSGGVIRVGETGRPRALFGQCDGDVTFLELLQLFGSGVVCADMDHVVRVADAGGVVIETEVAPGDEVDEVAFFRV